MNAKSPGWLAADWPAPTHVHAGTTLRQGGVSQPPWDSLNLAGHVDDDPAAVAQNRRRLGLPAGPVWLTQEHGRDVVNAATVAPGESPRADASFSTRPGVICAVLTADCLPLLLTDRAGSRVAAVHAGWRGLAAGIIEATVTALEVSPDELLAWLGPAIGPAAYEVGDEVRAAFVGHDPQAAACFEATRPGHGLLDLYALARRRLQRLGVNAVYGGGLCTFSDTERFFSYRRDGVTGRMASLIWLGDEG